MALRVRQSHVDLSAGQSRDSAASTGRYDGLRDLAGRTLRASVPTPPRRLHARALDHRTSLAESSLFAAIAAAPQSCTLTLSQTRTLATRGMCVLMLENAYGPSCQVRRQANQEQRDDPIRGPPTARNNRISTYDGWPDAGTQEQRLSPVLSIRVGMARSDCRPGYLRITFTSRCASCDGTRSLPAEARVLATARRRLPAEHHRRTCGSTMSGLRRPTTASHGAKLR